MFGFTQTIFNVLLKQDPTMSTKEEEIQEEVDDKNQLIKEFYSSGPFVSDVAILVAIFQTLASTFTIGYVVKRTSEVGDITSLLLIFTCLFFAITGISAGGFLAHYGTSNNVRSLHAYRILSCIHVMLAILWINQC